MPNERSLPDLAKWLRSVELEPGGDRQTAIATAAFSLADNIQGLRVFDIVLLAHGRNKSAAANELIDAIREADPTFAGDETDLETQLAAGATAAAMLQIPANAVLAAHGLLAAQWLGLTPVILDLPNLAQNTIRARSEVVRSRKAVSINMSAGKAFADVQEFPSNGTPVLHEDARSLLAATKKATGSLSKSIEAVAARLGGRFNSTDEELDTLWWAFSEYSERAQKRWADIESSAAAALLAGVELAETLRFEVEPPSALALVVRLLRARAHEAVSLRDAVENAAAAIEDLEAGPGHELLPLLSSLSEYRTLEGADTWRESIKRWSLDANTQSTAADLACQAVREILCLRAL